MHSNMLFFGHNFVFFFPYGIRILGSKPLIDRLYNILAAVHEVSEAIIAFIKNSEFFTFSSIFRNKQRHNIGKRCTICLIGSMIGWILRRMATTLEPQHVLKSSVLGICVVPLCSVETRSVSVHVFVYK